ncbi:MAG: hypothetical protein OEW30_17130 [Acidimicrobiia bacterium]|nr:hypothetical protein [Acidimicrobiia bacterium]
MAYGQVVSCALGFGGWLLWFWGADKADEVITADAHDAAVARAFSRWSHRIRATPDRSGLRTSRLAAP